MGNPIKTAGRAFGAVTGFITGGKSNAIASVGLTLAALTGGPLGGMMALAGDIMRGFSARNGPPTTGGQPTVFRQAVSDSFIVYGKRRVGGLLVFFHPRKVGKVHYRYFVIACAGHRCKQVVQWYLNDEAVTVDGSNKVTSGTYANKAWLWFQRGLDSETANATFVSECGGKWTSAHKGNGVAAIYAKFEMSDEVVQAGMPNITTVIEGKDDILDPRDATEKYTNNAALVFYDWMQIPREEGGFGAYEDEIPDDAYISAQANVCDETVDSEARYSLDGVIVTGAAPSEVRDMMVMNCAGSLTYTGGKFLMRPGYYVPPDPVPLSEDDLAGPIEVSAFLPSDQAINEVQGTYVDPEAGWQGAPFDTQTMTPAPTDVRQANLELPFITSKKRAERIASIVLNRAQHEISVTWPMNLSGLKVKAQDTVALDTTRYGLDDYVFTVTEWGLSSDFNLKLSLRQESEDIYEPPVPVAPVSPPALTKANPLLTTREVSLLIANSYTVPSQVLSASETGGVASIEVMDHQRVYPGDGVEVSVTGGTFGGLLTDTPYFLHYDDDEREGGAVTIVVTVDGAEAQEGFGRHSLGRIRTPVTASGVTYEGGGVYPAGSAIGGEVYL